MMWHGYSLWHPEGWGSPGKPPHSRWEGREGFLEEVTPEGRINLTLRREGGAGESFRVFAKAPLKERGFQVPREHREELPSLAGKSGQVFKSLCRLSLKG